MPKSRDPIWEFCIEEGKQIKCKFCNESFMGTITRMKYHLSKILQRDVRPCPSVNDMARDMALNAVRTLEARKKSKFDHIRSSDTGSGSGTGVGLGPIGPSGVGGSSSGSVVTFGLKSLQNQPHQQKITTLIKKKEKDFADLLLTRMMVANNLPFNLFRTIEFREAMAAVSAHGPGYVPPSSEMVRTKLLDCLKEETNDYITSIKKSWAISGCTVMSDSWTDARKRPHINLLASSPRGTIFLKSECTVGHKKDANYIANFIVSGIEEIGPHNVIQFISDNASNYVAAGSIVENRYPNIFKTACVAHCIDLMLEDIDKLADIKPTIDMARQMVKFFYRFQHVLDLMRVHTENRELKCPGATRFGTNFLCLQSILKEEESLRFMMASSGWRALPQSKTLEGREVMDAIQGYAFWERGRNVLLIVEPLFKVLRLADGDGSTMSYLHESLNMAKEAIKIFFKGEIAKYEPYIKIIDDRIDNLIYSPLHAFATYLNPLFRYEKNLKLDKNAKMRMNIVLNRMLSEEEKNTLLKELTLYHQKDPIIFDEMSIPALRTTHPRIWWDMWGSEAPTLQSMAIKLHSQPCSASGCERNWSAFEAAHTKKRNRLEPKKLHDLVFVRMNMHYRKMCGKKEQADSKPIYLDHIVAFPEDTQVERGDEDGGDDDFGYEVSEDENENEDANVDLGLDDFDRLMNPELDL